MNLPASQNEIPVNRPAVSRKGKDSLDIHLAGQRRADLFGLMTAPSLFILAFVVVPLTLMFLYSFWQVKGSNIVPAWTIQNYVDFFQKPLFYSQALKSIRVAIFVTCTCLAFGFPMANLIANLPPNRINAALLLTTLPMWSSYVVRIFAWRTILGLDGLFNSLLLGVHLIQEPIRAISFSQFAVYITLTNYLLPFMIMPLVATIEKIPRSQMEAARDLGAGKLRALSTILIPLCLPGIFVGSLNVFIISLADYLTPKLVGGTDGLMIGNVIQSEFGPAYNWPLGAAATYVSAAIALSILLALRWMTHRRANEVKF